MTDTNQAAVSIGDETLDRILNGGIPRNRSVLVTGGPGTGKSTLSMQFLQEGLETGDGCVFVSTEQTPPELRDTFEPFGFDLNHDNLTITSVHARPGYTLESDEEQLTIETLEGDQLIGEGYSAPFTSKYISQLLGQYAPTDRIVIDSVSGLRAMSNDEDVFRRAVLDLIRLFSDELEATALLVAEEREANTTMGGRVDPLQYSTHGVIKLWLKNIRSDIHRFLQVVKMRGVKHDTRAYEIGFGNHGVHIIPRHRNVAHTHSEDDSFINTHIPGLDELCGGGFASGESIVVEHDGRANLRPLFLGLLKRQLQADTAVLLVIPTVGSHPDRLKQLFPEEPSRIDRLLDADQLFVVDVVSQQESAHRNIFTVNEQQGGVRYLFELIDDRRGDHPLSTFIDTETAVRQFGPEQTIKLHHWQEAQLLSPNSTTMYVHNPATVSGEVSEFFANNAAQLLDIWRHENGLQYLTLEKSPAGYVGSTRLIDNVADPPYVRIQSPPGPEMMTRAEDAS